MQTAMLPFDGWTVHLAGETDFAAADQADPDRAGAGHHDGAVGAAVGAEAGGHAVTDENSGSKGMPDLAEAGFRAPAANAGEANRRVHPRQIGNR